MLAKLEERQKGPLFFSVLSDFSKFFKPKPTSIFSRNKAFCEQRGFFCEPVRVFLALCDLSKTLKFQNISQCFGFMRFSVKENCFPSLQGESFLSTCGKDQWFFGIAFSKKHLVKDRLKRVSVWIFRHHVFGKAKIFLHIFKNWVF